MHKKSRQREAIIRFLKSTNSHPTAEAVYEEVRREIPNVGLATIYRNLRLLSESGQIRAFTTSNGETRYDGNTRDHGHFRCDSCGTILDIDEPFYSRIEEAAKQSGLEVTHRYLELGGLCVQCQEQSRG